MIAINELDRIMELRNLRKIEKALKAAGFIDCKKDKTLRKTSLVTIIQTGTCQKTGYRPDGKGNEYTGSHYHNVKGYEQYEFVIVQLLAPYKRGYEDISTKKMLIYAKEV